MYTLGDIPKKSAILHGPRTAVVFEDTRLSYAQLNDRVNRLANALASMGVGSGDMLAILAENTHKYLEVIFAAGKLGLPVTPLNFRLSDEELAHIVKDSGCTALFVADAYEDRALGLGPLVGDKLRTWISMDRPHQGFLDYESLLSSASAREPDRDVSEKDMALLLYTGGTTGLPKGVMLAHESLMVGTISAALGMRLGKDDSTCFILPMFHVSVWPALAMLLAGGKVVINRRPDLVEILRLIQDERCTHINAVPTIYNWLLNVPDFDSYDLSSLRLITYAGSPFPPESLRRCIDKFGPKFEQVYAMTECVGGAYLSAEDHAPSGEKARLLASAGKPTMAVDLAIFDEDDRPVETGVVGEVVLRGKCVMRGYWKNPELTAKVMRGGWHHTGDMGYLDPDGYLFLVDRKADMIVTGGENVYPQETENVLYQHPAVAMAAVVSAPDDKWGERVQAVVVLKPDCRADETELIEFCRQHLAGYKCPKSVEFWDQIPTTVVGKISRKGIKAKFWAGHDRTIG